MRPRRLAPAVLLVIAALAVVGCNPAAQATAPAPPTAAVTTPEEAMAAVRARSPLFDGLARKDPNAVGQGSWWDAVPDDEGILVSIQVGWGDCQAGCIDRHTWAWEVDTDGRTTFVQEQGSPLPDDVLAGLTGASKAQGVGGRATAGPTCPVQRPNDPACAGRMVEGAHLRVTTAGGKEVATFTTDGSGLFRIALEPGEYTVAASPVEGLMGTPGPSTIEVRQGAETWLDLAYDTGIR